MKLKFIKSLIFVFSINCVYALDEQRTLLIFGDSISAGYGMSKEKQWSVLLQEKFNKENLKIKVINSSVSGETTGGGLSRLEKIIKQHEPNYVLLELGGNDALRGYPPKKISSNLVEMINISEISNANIFLMQIRIPPNYGSRYQKAFESIYPRITETTNAILIPFMLEEVALNADLMLPDGIHPKETAQPLIADFIYLQLKPLLTESQ